MVLPRSTSARKPVLVVASRLAELVSEMTSNIGFPAYEASSKGRAFSPPSRILS